MTSLKSGEISVQPNLKTRAPPETFTKTRDHLVQEELKSNLELDGDENTSATLTRTKWDFLQQGEPRNSSASGSLSQEEHPQYEANVGSRYHLTSTSSIVAKDLVSREGTQDDLTSHRGNPANLSTNVASFESSNGESLNLFPDVHPYQRKETELSPHGQTRTGYTYSHHKTNCNEISATNCSYQKYNGHSNRVNQSNVRPVSICNPGDNFNESHWTHNSAPERSNFSSKSSVLQTRVLNFQKIKLSSKFLK